MPLELPKKITASNPLIYLVTYTYIAHDEPLHQTLQDLRVYRAGVIAEDLMGIARSAQLHAKRNTTFSGKSYYFYLLFVKTSINIQIIHYKLPKKLPRWTKLLSVITKLKTRGFYSRDLKHNPIPPELKKLEQRLVLNLTLKIKCI